LGEINTVSRQQARAPFKRTSEEWLTASQYEPLNAYIANHGAKEGFSNSRAEKALGETAHTFGK